METIEKVEKQHEALYQLLRQVEKKIEGFQSNVEHHFEYLGSQIGRLDSAVQFMDRQVCRRLDEVDESLIDINTQVWSTNKQISNMSERIDGVDHGLDCVKRQIAAVDAKIGALDEKLDAVLAALAC